MPPPYVASHARGDRGGVCAPLAVLRLSAGVLGWMVPRHAVHVRRVRIGFLCHAPSLLPGLASQLAPSAAALAITQLEIVLGVHLPEDVRASYGRHDGGFPCNWRTP